MVLHRPIETTALTGQVPFNVVSLEKNWSCEPNPLQSILVEFCVPMGYFSRHQNRALAITFKLLGFVFHTTQAHSVGRSNHIAAVFCWHD